MKSCQQFIRIGIVCLLSITSLVGCDGSSQGISNQDTGIEKIPVEVTEPPYADPIIPDPEPFPVLDPDPVHEDVHFTWDWNEDEVDGYRIYYANISFYDEPINIQVFDVGYDNHCTIFKLNSLYTWFFVCTAYRGTSESEYSNEVVW